MKDVKPSIFLVALLGVFLAGVVFGGVAVGVAGPRTGRPQEDKGHEASAVEMPIAVSNIKAEWVVQGGLRIPQLRYIVRNMAKSELPEAHLFIHLIDGKGIISENDIRDTIERLPYEAAIGPRIVTGTIGYPLDRYDGLPPGVENWTYAIYWEDRHRDIEPRKWPRIKIASGKIELPEFYRRNQ